MATLCVIPARGGSKGVPRKNLLDVGGKPLIVWTIEQALAVPDLDVLVSTDDEEIAEVARDAGVRIHAIGFPESPGMTPFTNIRFSALMRLMCEQNNGTFVGITG